MLKKFKETADEGGPYQVGSPVFVVLRDGAILEGFHVHSRLVDMVSLDRSPLDGTEKQGFTITGGQLLPNWCEGKRKIMAACASRAEAEELSSRVRPGRSERKRPEPPPCH